MNYNSRNKITVADLSFISALTIFPSVILLGFQHYAALATLALSVGFYYFDSKFKYLKVEIRWFSITYWVALLTSFSASLVVYETNNEVLKFIPLTGLFYLFVLFVLCKPVLMED